MQSESGLHTTQANKGSPLGGLALGETNIRGTNFASKDSNYSLSGSGAQSQHGQAVGNSEIPKSIGTTNVGNTNRYSVDNNNLSGRSTTGAGAGNTLLLVMQMTRILLSSQLPKQALTRCQVHGTKSSYVCCQDCLAFFYSIAVKLVL